MNKSSEFQKSEESFNEECVGCNAPMSTETLSEEEFDEHPEREIGYDADGDWKCSDCRVQCDEDEERYCDNEVCPYGGYIYDEELEKYKGKEYVCVGCETGKGLQEREQEEDKDQHWGSAMSILLYGKEEEVCSDCDRGFGQLDANDVEMLGEGKYARCADCEDERFSHMEDACDECGDRVGRHAANVGTLGMAICFDCDSHGAMIENE